MGLLSSPEWFGYVGRQIGFIFVQAWSCQGRLALVKARQAGVNSQCGGDRAGNFGEAGSDFEGLIKRLEREGPNVALG
jgi:hypothetical protein